MLRRGGNLRETPAARAASAVSRGTTKARSDCKKNDRESFS
jgi:hypothetical protein